MAADPHRAATPPPSLTFPTEPSDFDSDERISFSKLDNKFIAVHDDGTEFEYDSQLKRWIPAIDEELVRQQQLAYGGHPTTEEDEYDNNDYENIQQYQRNKKRKKENGPDHPRPSKKQQRQNNNNGSQKSNTAVYVTGLPLDATADEVHEVFSRKCGVVAEEIDSGRPRIKMYADEQGNFKGDALVVFFKPQSVEMAIMLLDDTDFRYTTSGLTAGGRMRVQAADSSYKKTNYDNNNNNNNNKGAVAEGGGEDKTSGSSGAGAGAEKIESGGGNSSNNGSDTRPKDSRAREQDKQKIIKRTQKLDAKLADWDDDDPYGGGQPETASLPQRRDRLVILRHMFTLRELEEDPAALLEIKEDVREECSKLGPVTNVVLYDLEPDGVVAVKFRHPEAAEACVRLMDGRAFDGRIVRATVAAGRERYRRSDKKQEQEQEQDDNDEDAADENDAGKNTSVVS